MFLGSLEFALETGDIETAKKLTKWRRSLLQVGRITGWEVALAIGLRTYQKQEITAADIIQANY
jgi:urease accessory protein UreF